MDFENLNKLLDEHKYADFIKEIDEMNAVDSAEYLTVVDPENLLKVFRMLKKDTAAEIFAELDSDVQKKIIDSISDSEISKIIDQLYIDDTVDMLEELPANVVNRVLRNTQGKTRAEINRFLKYPEDSAGSVMTSEFISIHSTMTVNDAIKYIRRTGSRKETVYVVYVTDKSRILLGTVELRDLMFAGDDDVIENIMDTSIVSALTTDDKETVASLISKYDLLALPVVDSENRLVGIVTVDDALDVIEEEATEDIEIMAAIVPTDKPYLKTGIFETWKKRIPWLLLLMVSATFTGGIINHYESALGQMVILTSFIPMIMDTGGNAGGQSSATIIRGLSLGEIRMGNILRVLWKELRVALLCGLTLGAAAFVKALLIDRATPMVGLVVALTLACSVIFAKLVGSSLPILAKRIGFDPAVMASPFITTIVDAIALLVYFRIASAILGL
ncbi:MAG: magnesium transporter [Eubacteriales bacterium]